MGEVYNTPTSNNNAVSRFMDKKLIWTHNHAYKTKLNRIEKSIRIEQILSDNININR